MTTEEIKDLMAEQVQSVWNNLVKPDIIVQMKRFKISKIEYVMGVVFFTVKGKQIASDDFATTEARKLFVETLIDPWDQKPYCALIDIDITI